MSEEKKDQAAVMEKPKKTDTHPADYALSSIERRHRLAAQAKDAETEVIAKKVASIVVAEIKAMMADGEFTKKGK
jgi:hypothetical protein